MIFHAALWECENYNTTKLYGTFIWLMSIILLYLESTSLIFPSSDSKHIMLFDCISSSALQELFPESPTIRQRSFIKLPIVISLMNIFCVTALYYNLWMWKISCSFKCTDNGTATAQRNIEVYTEFKTDCVSQKA